MILVKYKIRKETHVNTKNLLKVIRAKVSWRKRREATPKLKRLNCEQSTGILTRSVLRDILFNNG